MWLKTTLRIAAIFLILAAGYPAYSQNPMCPTRPAGDSSNACASTAFVATAVKSAVTPKALTKVDDTNVTITLGGTPATALLQDVTLTMGWASTLSLTRGGTGKALTASNGGIVWTDADSMEVLAGTATAGQMLRSGISGTPSWSTATWPATATGTGTILRADGTNWVATTATYPTTTTVNQLLYSSSANVIAGLATGNNGTLITSAGGVPSISSTLPTVVQQNITNLGTVTVGTWNATTIAVANGGTGDTGTDWTLSNPAVVCGSGTLTSGSASMRVKQIGKTTFINLTITITTNGTCASTIGVNTSINSESNALFAGRNVSSGAQLLCNMVPGSAAFTMLTAASAYPGADSTTLVCTGVFEAQ